MFEFVVALVFTLAVGVLIVLLMRLRREVDQISERDHRRYLELHDNHMQNWRKISKLERDLDALASAVGLERPDAPSETWVRREAR